MALTVSSVDHTVPTPGPQMDENGSMRCGNLRRLAFHPLEPPNHIYPQAQSALCVAPAPRAQRVGSSDVRLLQAPGALALGALARVLADTGASHPQRRGEGRLCDPVLGDAVGTYVEDKAGMASQPEHACQLAEAGRGWPRLAEAGGHPELDPALSGSIKAGGRIGPTPLGGCLPRSAAPCFCSDSLWRSGRL